MKSTKLKGKNIMYDSGRICVKICTSHNFYKTNGITIFQIYDLYISFCSVYIWVPFFIFALYILGSVCTFIKCILYNSRQIYKSELIFFLDLIFLATWYVQVFKQNMKFCIRALNLYFINHQINHTFVII